MKGCAGTCLLWIGIWALAAGAYWLYLREFGTLEPQIYWAAGIAGLCTTTIAAYAFNIATAWRERKVLLDAVSGEPPRDDEWTAVSGTIRAMNPLRAPLSGTTVVAYMYKIFERRRTSKGSSSVAVYEGKGLTPSTITTRHGAVRLLAVPAFDMKPEMVPRETGLHNAKEYVAATDFRSQRGSVEEESTDDDGSYRVDRSFFDDPPRVDFDECTFEEYLIRQGDAICAFGLYSQQRGGIIPHPNWANQMRIMRGDAQTNANELRKRMIRYGIGIAIFASAAFGILKWYAYAVTP